MKKKGLSLLFALSVLLLGCTGYSGTIPSSSEKAGTSAVSGAESGDESETGQESQPEDEPSSEDEQDSSRPPASVTPPQIVSSAPAVSTAPPVTPPSQTPAPPPPASSAPVRKEVTVTIPEGYTFMQIAALLEKNGVCSQQDFYNTCQSYTPKSFTISTDPNRCFRMEGYLFPDTYRFYQKDDPQSVLIKMLNNYHSRVGNLSEDTLILASIIEREARSDEHMKLVSSVFHNRLAAGMYLDADPTRDYVNQYITGNALVANQGKYAALYNTYGKRMGLPVGPICSPGLRAIAAAKNPTATSYLYFFYGKDGQNHYSETLEEHEQKISEIGVG